MSENSLRDTVKVRSRTITIFGFALALLGVLAMAAPLAVGLSVAVMIGVLLIFSGVGQLLFGFQEGMGNRVFNLVTGALTVVCGLLMIGHPLFGLGFMTLLLIAFFIVSGICEIVYTFDLRPMQGWPMVLVSGAISLLLGILIWRQWPLSGSWAIGVLVGIRLFMLGVMLAMLGIATRTMVHEAEALGN